MPLVAHSGLPSFARLEAEGFEVLSAQRARRQDIRELHIGLLNLMPDAALEATERQFLRLVGGCNRIAQIYVHPFAVHGQERGPRARAHIDAHYRDFGDLKEDGLDALILTGANPANPDLTRESFWPGMLEVMDWARMNVSSTLCSCLATHAVLQVYHGIERIKLPGKRWGVYSHRLVERSHPLLAHIDTRFDAPHSHVYEVTAAQVRASGGHVLVESAEAGVHLAVSGDGFRFVYFQGHPEYDFNSLLKEHKREVVRFATGEREDFPPPPDHYYGEEARERIEAFAERARAARVGGTGGPEFPEPALTPLVDNTWGDTGKALFNNWLGLVYQLTHLDRSRPFMDGVDPQDPLGWRGCASSPSPPSGAAAPDSPRGSRYASGGEARRMTPAR